MDLLKPNHRWQVAWWIMSIVFVQFCASTTTTCSTMGSVGENKGDQQIHTSSIYFDLDHPARCSGYIRELHYCYYATNFNGFVRDNPVHQAVIQIWREELETEELHRVHEYMLTQDTSQDDHDEFVCRNESLRLEDYIIIKENDVIGVTLPIYTLTAPLQLISTNTTGFGLYLEPLSSTSVKKVKASSLTWHKELVLHLHAVVETNASVESSANTTSTKLTTAPTYSDTPQASPTNVAPLPSKLPEPPVARFMPRPQTSIHARIFSSLYRGSSKELSNMVKSTDTVPVSAGPINIDKIRSTNEREGTMISVQNVSSKTTHLTSKSVLQPIKPTHTANSKIPSSILTAKSNSHIFNILASPMQTRSLNIQSMSLSRDVGSEFPHPQSMSTFQTQSFSSLSISASGSSASQSSQNFNVRSSSIPVSMFVSFSEEFSRQVTHTKSLHTLNSESTQSVTWNPSLQPPSLSSQSSFTPTIIAGIVAIALALATMAGCTLIGCIAIIHCKHRTHRVDSSGERDDKDTISMKDDSLLPDTAIHSGSGVSSMHSISELTMTVGSSPTTTLTSTGSEDSSQSSISDNQLNGCTSSKQSNHSRNSPATHPQRQADGSAPSTALIIPKINGHCGIAPLPVLLTDGHNPIISPDHDYEELASQRNSINELHTSIIRTMSGNGLMPKCVGHRERMNSMPIIAKKERRPVVEHDYDEPICNRKPVYQNGFLATKNNSKSKLLLIRGQSSPANQSRPIIVVVGPKRGAVKKSKTKDYEVPISSADHTVETAGSAVADLKSTPPLGSLRLNKAKSMRVVAKQGHSDEAMMYRSGSVGMESRIRVQLQARKYLPDNTGSSPSQQGKVEVESRELTMDGPYCEPPSEVAKLLEFLKQLNVDNIAPKDVNIPNFGQFGSQPLKSRWRKSDEVIVDISLKVASTEEAMSERVKLLQEAAILAQFRHPNVVRLFGITNKDNVVMVIFEYFPKEDLRKFLIQMGRSIIPPDTPKLLLSFSQQVALGMQYLASKGFVHKDLAARNVFVTNNDTCKVGEVLKSKELSQVGDGILLDKILIKWTAPEAMYHHKYSTASDVWSYGCLLYEIWSLGRTPFKTFTNKEVIEKVDSGYRLPPPPGCPRAIYELMIQCWNPQPLSRPNFKEILNVLLKDETQILQIPVKDACTHDAAIVLGSELEAGNYMYTDLQRTYDNSANSTPTYNSGSAGKDNKKRSDYDHISGQNFLFTFPTSAADLECVFNGASTTTNSVVPQPSLSLKSSPRSTEVPVALPFHREKLHSLDSDYEVMY